MAQRFNPLTGKVEEYAQSVKGERGEQGPVGPQGPQGIPGIDGRDGKDGRDGIDGRDGADGKQGPVGPQGPKGERGPRGPAGKDAENKSVVHRTLIGYPPADLGQDGDWAFNEAGESFYRDGGKWSFYTQLGNLKQGGSGGGTGSIGPTGPAGAIGPTGPAGSGGAIGNDSITGSMIRLANAEYLRSLNSAGTGDISLIRGIADNAIQIGSGDSSNIYIGGTSDAENSYFRLTPNSTTFANANARLNIGQAQGYLEMDVGTIYLFGHDNAYGGTDTLNLRFSDVDETNFVTIKAPQTINTDYNMVLPSAAPLTGQVIAASTTGELYFTSITAGTAREFTGPAFTYNSGTLTRIDYDDGSYKEFTYSLGQLTQIDFFISGGDTIRKTFNYTGDVLTSIDQTTL